MYLQAIHRSQAFYSNWARSKMAAINRVGVDSLHMNVIIQSQLKIFDPLIVLHDLLRRNKTSTERLFIVQLNSKNIDKASIKPLNR